MDIKSILTDQKYQFVLQGLHKGTIGQINQRAEGNTVLDYPELRDKLGVSTEDSQTIIDGLFDQGLLERKGTGQTLACPQDDSVHINARLFCSKCSSGDVVKTDLVEHYKCGNIGSQEKYAKGQELVCPKCNGTLNQIGVDYKKLSAFSCRKCGERMSRPPLQFECKDYGHLFNVNEAHIIKLYTYTLTDKARKELDRELFDFAPLITYFEELGFKVKTPLIISGFSGIKHQFDILGIRNSERRESMLLKLVPTDYTLRAEEVQRIFAEVMDTQPDHAIIAAIPASSSDAKSFAEINNITIVDGRKAEVIVQRLKESRWADKRIRYAGGEEH